MTYLVGDLVEVVKMETRTCHCYGTLRSRIVIFNVNCVKWSELSTIFIVSIRQHTMGTKWPEVW